MAEETTATTTTTTTDTAATVDTNTTATNATDAETQAKETVLSSEAIKKLIQSTVDSRTAELGKTIAELKKENGQLKKANMTAEEIQKTEKEEFAKEKAEFELQKRQLYAHKAVAGAGYGDNAEAVVEMVLGETDEVTDKRLEGFKALIDKIVSEKVAQTFKDNGRTPNGGKSKTDETKTSNIAETLGKTRAEQQKKSNDVLSHYLGGK